MSDGMYGRGRRRKSHEMKMREIVTHKRMFIRHIFIYIEMCLRDFPSIASEKVAFENALHTDIHICATERNI
jgi:hypothetical protein